MPGTTLTTGLTADFGPPDTSRRIFSLFAASGGEPVKIAIFTDGSSTFYTVYRAGAGGWGTAVSFVSSNIFTHATFIGLRVPKGSPSTSTATDVVYVFYGSTSGTTGSIHEIALQFVGPSTVNVITAPTLNPGFYNYQYMDGDFAPALGVWHIALGYSGGVSTPNLMLFGLLDILAVDTLTNTISLGIISQLQSATSWQRIQVQHYTPGGVSTVYVLALGSGGSLYVIPVTVTGTPAYSWNAGLNENFSGVTPDFASFLNQSNGHLIFAVTLYNAMYTSIRSGSNTYSGYYLIADNLSGGGAGSSFVPSFILDGNTGDLYLAFTTFAEQANGEIWLAKRPSGWNWSPAFPLIGRDAGGYTCPSLADTFSSAGSPPAGYSGKMDLLFLEGTNPYTLQWIQEAALTPPQPPTQLTSGPIVVSSLAAVPISWQYNNSDPASIQTTYRAQVGAPASWDSTTVTSAAGSTTVGATLTAGQTYTLTITTGNASGTNSASSSFTPYHAPTVAITGVVGGPNSSGSSIASGATCAYGIVNISFTPTDTDGLSCVYYQQQLLDTDGSTVIATSSKTASAIASGTSFTAADWNWSLGATYINDGAHTYYWRIASWSQATGGQLLAYSAPWPFMPDVILPDPVTAFTVVPAPFTGQTALAWTNPADPNVQSIIVSRRPSGTSAWTQIAAGGTPGNLPTRYQYLQDLNVPQDFMVQTASVFGTISAGAVVSNVTLTPWLGLPIRITDELNPTTQDIAVGLTEASNFESAFLHTLTQNIVETVSPGRQFPTVDRNPISYLTGKGIKFTIQATQSDGTHSLDGWDIVQTLMAMGTNGNKKLFRLWNGFSFEAFVSAPQWNAINVSDYEILYDLVQCGGPIEIVF